MQLYWKLNKNLVSSWRREAAITLRETFISTFNRLAGPSRGKNARASVYVQTGGVCAVHTHLKHAGLPGCARTPMVRIPKVKDSRTDPDVGGASSLFATCLVFSASLSLTSYRVFPRSRPRESRPRKVLTTRRIIPSIPHCIIRLIDEQPRVMRRTLDAKKNNERNIVAGRTSLCRIIDVDTDRASSIAFRTNLQRKLFFFFYRESLMKFFQ